MANLAVLHPEKLVEIVIVQRLRAGAVQYRAGEVRDGAVFENISKKQVFFLHGVKIAH